MSGSGASGSQRRELDLTGVEKPSESVGAARLIDNRKNIAVVAQDAVPVYLDLSTGKVCVKASSLDERRHRELARRMIKEGHDELVLDVTGIEQPSSSVGAARRQKNRLTLFMRHALLGLWDEEMETPKGEMLDFVPRSGREARSLRGHESLRTECVDARPLL